jgi:hypothetical protein
MRHMRYSVLILISAGFLVLLWTLPGLGTLPSQEPLPTTADPAAAQLLDQAVAVLDPAKCSFLETNVWQRVHLQQLEYESEGRFVGGPRNRYRMEFHTCVAGCPGTLLQVCDGSYLWQGTQAKPGPWLEVRRIQLVNGISGPVMPTDLGARGFSFSGVGPLLSKLRQQMLWVRQEKAQLQDAECVLLTGVWPASVTSSLAPAGMPWPEDLPNQCRLWLDGRTLWPRRVEWLSAGPTPRNLVEMELREPRFSLEMSPQRCQVEFTFDPGNSKVVELTLQGGQSPSWQKSQEKASVF